jgi:hypothetical protein
MATVADGATRGCALFTDAAKAQLAPAFDATDARPQRPAWHTPQDLGRDTRSRSGGWLVERVALWR